MIFSPYFWLAIAAICSVCYVAGCTHERKALVAVENAWEADKKERQSEVNRIDKERKDSIAAVTAEAAKKDASRQVAFNALHTQNSALADRLRASRVDSVLLDSLRNSVNAANGSDPRPADSPADDAPAAATATGSDAGQVSDWFEQVAGFYARCRDQVGNLISAYDKVRAAH